MAIRHVGAALGSGTAGDQTVSQFLSVVGGSRYNNGHFFFGGKVPTSLASSGQGLPAYAGVYRATVDFELTHYGVNGTYGSGGTPASGAVTDRGALDSWIASCLAGGLDLRICLWHEPYNKFNTQSTLALNVLNYTNSIGYYGATLRKYGIPVYFDPSNYSADHSFATVIGTAANPGLGWSACSAGYIDEINSDWYVNQDNSATTPAGSGRQGTLDNCANLADAFGLPFGLLEYGYAPATNGVNWNQADIDACQNYTKTFFQNRLAAGKDIGDIIIWATNDNATQPGMYLSTVWSASTITNYQWFFDTLDGGTYGGGVFSGFATPYTIVQAAQSIATSSTSYQATITHGVAQGDAIVVGATNNANTISSVTDSKGNNYILAQQQNANTMKTAVFTCQNATPLTANTDWIRVNFLVSTAGQIAFIARGCPAIALAAAVDAAGSGAASGNSAAPAMTGTRQIAQSQEWVVAVLADGNTPGPPSAWGGGFTQITQVEQPNQPYLTVAELFTTTTSAPVASATLPVAGVWALCQVALKSAAQAPPTQIPLRDAAGALDGFSVRKPKTAQTPVSIATLNAGAGPLSYIAPVTVSTGPGGVILVGINVVTGTVANITDTRGNAYVQVGSPVSGLYVFRCKTPLPLTGGVDSIIITLVPGSGTLTDTAATADRLQVVVGSIGTPYTVAAGVTTLSTGTTYQITATASTTAADAIVVSATDNQTAISGVTDSQGNTYVLSQSNSATAMHVYQFTALNTTRLVSGTDWIKITFGNITSLAQVSFIARGCSGVTATDAAGSANAGGTSVSPAITGTSTLAVATEWVSAALANGNAGGVPSAPGGGFTQILQEHTSGQPYLTLYELLTASTAAPAASATITSAVWGMCQTALKP